jgi:transglutaminase-like putative cysteine protease
MRLAACALFSFAVVVSSVLLGRSREWKTANAGPYSAIGNPEKERTFHFAYSATVKDLPSGKRRVRVWIPLATSDVNQKVVVNRIESLVPTRVTREPRYGNRILYAEVRDVSRSQYTFRIMYEITRKQYSKGDYSSLLRYDRERGAQAARLDRFLKPDRLVPTDGKMKQIADENTRDQNGAVAKAHALYDYVFKTLRYDKSGTGWGRGDSLWACDAKHGNCTDFHSLFISLARAEHIPARFEIGFPVPEGQRQGTIPGYHCWAEFYVNGPGWVPVDISEAWKNPAKHDYFFGTLDANRVQLSIGRDLALVPRQDGPPLNYLVYPYVEVDGRPYDRLENTFAFQEARDTALSAIVGEPGTLLRLPTYTSGGGSTAPEDVP